MTPVSHRALLYEINRTLVYRELVRRGVTIEEIVRAVNLPQDMVESEIRGTNRGALDHVTTPVVEDLMRGIEAMRCLRDPAASGLRFAVLT